MESFERILVVSYSTHQCRKAVHIGISMARMYGAKLYVLHVVHDPFSLEGWNLPIPSLHDEYIKLIEKCKKDLHRIVEKEKGLGLDVVEWVHDRKPVEEIVNVVESEKIDVMIMCAHEEGRIEHFLFGRTNEALLRKMPCSILMVKQ